MWHKGIGGLLGVLGGCQGCTGVASGLGAQPHWVPVQGPSTPTGSSWGVTYLTKARQGPLLRVPSLPLVSLGEGPTWPRPSKWQKSALQAIIYIWNYISWQFAHLYLCHLITYSYMQCKEMLYMDNFLCKPIYAYPYTTNLMYYDTMVLIMNNYFSHQTSEVGTSYCKCQTDLM